jgi:hypothetical protein
MLAGHSRSPRGTGADSPRDRALAVLAGRWVLAGLLTLSACSTSIAPQGILSRDADIVGTKLLRRGAVARACQVSFFGVSSPTEQREPFHEALDRLLALDSEGNAVANAQIRSDTFVSGIYNRRCVEIKGDVSRVVSTIILPGHDHGNN